MNEYNILSKRLKELLEKNNMSQRELAEKTDITEVTISRYVSAQRIPKATEIVKIADALNCSCDYLLGIEKEKSIAKILEETCNEMCDKYCKYPGMYTPEGWENVFEDICNKCPLMRLV